MHKASTQPCDKFCLGLNTEVEVELAICVHIAQSSAEGGMSGLDMVEHSQDKLCTKYHEGSVS